MPKTKPNHEPPQVHELTITGLVLPMAGDIVNAADGRRYRVADKDFTGTVLDHTAARLWFQLEPIPDETPTVPVN